MAQLALEGRAKELGGIGKTIEEKIVQVVEKGEIGGADEAEGDHPRRARHFLRLPGLGPKTVRRIWQELGVSTVVP